MQATLFKSDNVTIYGTTEVPQFPDSPEVIIWQGKAFYMKFDANSPNQRYIEVPSLVVTDNSVKLIS